MARKDINTLQYEKRDISTTKSLAVVDSSRQTAH